MCEQPINVAIVETAPFNVEPVNRKCSTSTGDVYWLNSQYSRFYSIFFFFFLSLGHSPVSLCCDIRANKSHTGECSLVTPHGAATSRWTELQQGDGWDWRNVRKGAGGCFPSIWCNPHRLVQPAHNSGNVWILLWALTYITMTSKHNFRAFRASSASCHLFSSCLFPLCPSLTRRTVVFDTTPLCFSPAVWKSPVCANKIHLKSGCK